MINKILGYYKCDNKEFSSKIEACIYGTKNKKEISWHFNDEIFDKFDWSIEPNETLDQLYDKRARELREKYDYLVLAFSGGADSNNILECFIRQNLHIDEIVVNVMDNRNIFTKNNKNIISSWNEGAEYYLQTIPRLEYIKKVSPKTKISVIDLSDQIFNFFKKIGDESWITHTRERLNVSGFMRHNFIHFSEIRKNFDKNYKIAMILGLDKPRTYIKNNIFKILFSDKAINIATVQEFMTDYTNTAIEYFYWHPDSVKIICKQAHVIKKFIEFSPQYLEAWTPKNLADMFIKHRSIHERVLRSVIYSTWDQSYWQADKSTLDWYSQIDDWFIKGYKDTKEFRIWKAGLDYIEANASDYVYNVNGDIGLNSFMKAYEIGTMIKT
jgi:hypothetical protein